LGVTLLGERLPPTALARGNARFLTFNCLGSLVGPAVAGAAMDLFGKRALFVAGQGAVLLVLGTWGIQRYIERRAARAGQISDSGATTTEAEWSPPTEAIRTAA